MAARWTWPVRYSARMRLTFSGIVFHWRGPAPHYFVKVTDNESDAIAAVAKRVTYGWGMIPVRVGIGASEWKTSLFPKNGGYLVPLRADIRAREGIAEGDAVAIQLDIDV